MSQGGELGEPADRWRMEEVLHLMKNPHGQLRCWAAMGIGLELAAQRDLTLLLPHGLGWDLTRAEPWNWLEVQGCGAIACGRY